VRGSGTAADPYTVTTTVRAGSALRIAQTESHVTGSPAWTVRITVTNLTGQFVTARVSRGVDCSLGVPDTAYGFSDAATGASGCADNAAHTAAVQALVPEAGSSPRHLVAAYKTVWSALDAQNPLPNTCTSCGIRVDNAVALQWDLPLAPGAAQTVAVSQVVAGDGALPAPAPPPAVAAPSNPPAAQPAVITPLSDGGASTGQSTGHPARTVATCPARRTIRLAWALPRHRTTKGRFTLTVGGKRYGTLNGYRRNVTVSLPAGSAKTVKITLRVATTTKAVLSGSYDVTSCASPSAKAKPKALTLRPLG